VLTVRALEGMRVSSCLLTHACVCISAVVHVPRWRPRQRARSHASTGWRVLQCAQSQEARWGKEACMRAREIERASERASVRVSE